jgi:hypothetical protein
MFEAGRNLAAHKPVWVLVHERTPSRNKSFFDKVKDVFGGG